MISTSVEIGSPPEVVRKVFLDFSTHQEWHDGIFKKLTPLSENDPLAVGTPIHCSLEGMEFEAMITENSPTCFQWQGPPVMGITGLHSFLFEPSKVVKGGTTFTQKEEFSGAISFLMQPWLLGSKLNAGFQKFNADLKVRVEGL
ncbi:hypothetical protein G7Y89_g996 [Cudoniella acicularis]|uniref:Polyketide cyclase n=1 Tax=Cudoniella acicularis TaxID=354080 RepID=A0A8H4RXW8_9HELO|nr:hypothetical protein G7Y89_g996 [Cudoniella acicularis]